MAVESPLGKTEYTHTPVIRFLGSFPEWTFDDSLSAIVEHDPEGYESVRIIGPDGQAVATADGVNVSNGTAGNVTRLIRGGHGLPEIIVDAEGNETRLSYTADGLVEERDDLDRGRARNVYNAFGC